MIITPDMFKFSCDCGKEHRVSLKAAVIEDNILSDRQTIRGLRKKHGLDGKAAAVYDENTYKAVVGKRPEADSEIILNPENLHADETSTAQVIEKTAGSYDVLIAVGSGTIHDIVRYSAAKLNLPFISVPTAASVDGYVSSVAAMTWGGYKVTIPAIAPELLFADLDIIRNAPRRLTTAGVGDIIGKYTALADWKIGHLLTGEYFCGEIYSLMKSAADKVKDSYAELNSGNIASYESMMYALILSGIAMQLCGNSRPASGAEHHFSHMVEIEPEWLSERCENGNNALHGEKVGIGTLSCVKNYKKWLGIKAEQLEFNEPCDYETLPEIFRTQYDSVLRENQNDVAKTVDFSTVIKNWEEILKFIDEIPSADEIEKILITLNASKSLSDIRISGNDTEEKLLYWSPYVRNRLTFSRMSHYIKVK